MQIHTYLYIQKYRNSSMYNYSTSSGTQYPCTFTSTTCTIIHFPYYSTSPDYSTWYCTVQSMYYCAVRVLLHSGTGTCTCTVPGPIVQVRVQAPKCLAFDLSVIRYVPTGPSLKSHSGILNASSATLLRKV